jgi:DNA/RNA endonuclease YhcR with UshA esterase domain
VRGACKIDEGLLMNVKSIAATVAVVLLGTVAPSVIAHHSFAVHYDSENTRIIEGVARSFRFTNPHGILILEVTNDAGEIETWTIETTSPTFMRRRGWSQDMIKPGDFVRVDGYVSRDGSHLMRIRSISGPDGAPLAQPLEAGDD